MLPPLTTVSYTHLDVYKRQLGDKKTALFLIMSDTDATFNFLISMIYTQLFLSLIHISSGNGGMMDENDRYQEYFDYFSDQLSMDLLKKDYPYDSEMLDNKMCIRDSLYIVQ